MILLKYKHVVSLVVCLGLVALCVPSAQAQPQSNGSTQRVIVVRQAEIQGQVFISSDREGEEEAPARNALIQLKDSGNDKVLQKTYTNDQGEYTLSEVEVGEYLLFAGSLKMKIRVESPETTEQNELPKKIIVIIPRKMAMYTPR